MPPGRRDDRDQLRGSREVVEKGVVPTPALALVRDGRHAGAVFGRAVSDESDKRRAIAEMLLLAPPFRADGLALLLDAWVSRRSARGGR